MTMIDAVQSLARKTVGALLLGALPGAALAATERDAAGVVDTALALRGVPYRNAGTTPQRGFDCSGFVGYVFQRAAGVELPRMTRDIAKVGQRVARSELQAGDLVFFNTLGHTFSHVGIYISDGKFVHSPSSGKVVSVVDMNQKYWAQRYSGARRLLDDMLFAQAPRGAKPGRVQPQPQERTAGGERHANARDGAGEPRAQRSSRKPQLVARAPVQPARRGTPVPPRGSEGRKVAERHDADPWAGQQPVVIYMVRSPRGEYLYFMAGTEPLLSESRPDDDD
jgi:NlpC/P60 family